MKHTVRSKRLEMKKARNMGSVIPASFPSFEGGCHPSNKCLKLRVNQHFSFGLDLLAFLCLIVAIALYIRINKSIVSTRFQLGTVVVILQYEIKRGKGKDRGAGDKKCGSCRIS